MNDKPTPEPQRPCAVRSTDVLGGALAALRVQMHQLEKTIEYGGPSEICRAIDCVDFALQDVRRAAIPCLIDHAKVAKGLKCPGCGEVPNPLSDMIVSAPTGEELRPTKEEQEHFERLLRWQEESARSPIRLGGKPPNTPSSATAD